MVVAFPGHTFLVFVGSLYNDGLQLSRGGRDSCVAMLSCGGYLCYASLPHGAVGCSVVCNCGMSWPRGYKTSFKLNSTEHEIYPA